VDDLFFRNRLVGDADGGGTDGDMDHMRDEEYANDNDLGGGADFDDGDGDDGGFVTFMAMDENGACFSLISFNTATPLPRPMTATAIIMEENTMQRPSCSLPL
jgi:hypothetical protein